MQLALKARSQPVRTVSFVPPMISTGHPDIAKIHATVASGDRHLRGQEAGRLDGDEALDGGSDAADQGTTGGSIGNLTQGYAANQADDLSSAC